jgi:hypothetical protein
MVLALIMAIAIIALGYIARSDVELASGRNMAVRTQMDLLAESGLEHARGLILNPQDIVGSYWTGATDQQLRPGSNDYYDVVVVRDDSDPNNRCNYDVTCEAYRIVAEKPVGRSRLTARVRLDPCVSVWSGGDLLVRNGYTVYGDVYAAGAVTVANSVLVNGDVFAPTLSGTISGRHALPADLSLDWPAVTAADFTSQYSTVTLGSSLSGTAYDYGSPVRICHRAGSLTIGDDVTIDGMLLVEGNLALDGDWIEITAGKNVPAVYVTGDMIVRDADFLAIAGLVVVDGDVLISAAASNVTFAGAVFAGGNLVEAALDSSGFYRDVRVYGAPTWWSTGGVFGGALEFDGVNDKIEDLAAPGYLNGLAAVTVSLWVKSDVIGEDRGIFFSRDETTHDWDLGLRYDAVAAESGQVSAIKASVRTDLGYREIESTGGVQTTDWQHLALVWETGSSPRLYINSGLNPLAYDLGPISGTISGVEKLMVGRGTKGTTWDGLIDDVRVYNAALDANDLPPSDGLGGLLAHWRLDEPGFDVEINAAPTETAIVLSPTPGATEHWGQAADAFLRSIRRQ